MTNYLLIDGNSLGNAANNTKVLSLGSQQTQAIVGFLKMLRKQVALYPHYTPIVLWDGASWRYQMFPEYKTDRERNDTKHEKALLEAKAHYKTQVPYIKKALRLLGVAQVSAMNMEADDLAAIMSRLYTRKGGRVILLTGDQDWIQLVDERVIWKTPIGDSNRTVTFKNFVEETGVSGPKQFVEMKALTGDKGDSIPGVGGIGEKGAIEFLATYGSFSQFMNAVTFEGLKLDSLPKKFRDLAESEDKMLAFDRNLRLMDLHHPARPAPFNMIVDKGEPDLTKFTRFCEILLFKSITDNMSAWIGAFPAFREQQAA